MNKNALINELGNEAAEFILSYTGDKFDSAAVVKTNNLFNIQALDAAKQNYIVNINKMNNINGINAFLKSVNEKLSEHQYYIGCVETYNQRKERLLHKYPFILAQVYIFFDFIFKRIFPKLKLTRWLYFFITAGRNRVLSKAEILGRIVFNGFNIKEIKEIGNLTYIVCEKTDRPIPDKIPSFGILFKMKRLGKGNKLITVYKIRTMHPYAEFIQSYVFETNNLQDGGKFKNDYRITSWGKFLRKFWLDELPMFINFFRGELKLVGVRPLSEHYLSLYTDELKEKRKLVKPGLLPPFYADIPTTLEEIMDSELKYINHYLKHPLKTDFMYFFKATKNILFNKAKTN